MRARGTRDAFDRDEGRACAPISSADGRRSDFARLRAGPAFTGKRGRLPAVDIPRLSL